ncbi:uncharacterized protein [Acropora muricata]|uniref:uncharacterized protein n=1 Tax=Acropora muricata TaxID=159855 RepID=UPI0034E52C70
MCEIDLESMFYQVKVPEEGRDLLRFLWWDEGDTSKEPKEYRMTVHLSGAASSPGCSNFALKTTAEDNERSLGSAPAEFLRRDFYVDDGLKSLPSVEEAVDLANSVKEMCNRGGFNLHNFTSNSKEVIQRIPASDRAEDLKSMDFERDTIQAERALGIQWCIETFKFIISSKDRPCTRRGILSEVSTIFNPLGFVAPVLLEGKAILQELCHQNVGTGRPLKIATVPRLELTTAVVSVRVSDLLRKQLDLDITTEVFWTDSRVVLGYIANDVRRFHIFVAIRVQQIQEKSSVKQWRYIDTKSNPADDASRGVRPKDLSKSKWIKGPDFLWKEDAVWETSMETISDYSVSQNDPEVKKALYLATEVSPSLSSTVARLEYFSEWHHPKKGRRSLLTLRTNVVVNAK